MKKLGSIVFAMLLLAIAAKAGHGKKNETKAVFTAKRGQLIEVFIDGRLINRHPQEEVKVKMLPGKRHVKVKVVNRRGRTDFVVQNRIHVSHGYTNFYSMERNRYGEFGIAKTGQLKYGPHKSSRAYDGDHDRKGRDRRLVICRNRY
jgi:hypothetical protein